MSLSLLPERPLLISPTLAATIGLEEALMLQMLAEIVTLGEVVKRPLNPNLAWVKLGNDELQETFPFWTPDDIKRVLTSLQTLGILLIDPLQEGNQYNYFAVDDTTSSESLGSVSSRKGQVSRKNLFAI